MARDGFKGGGNTPGNSGGQQKGSINATEFNDHIQGQKNSNDIINGLGGDDVLIGYAGEDTIAGGSGHDDITGGADNDTMTGGIWVDDGDNSIEIGSWSSNGGILIDPTPDDTTNGDEYTEYTYTFAREFTQDSDPDHFIAGSSFEANGSDTVYGYDEALDTIQINALTSALDAIVASDDLGDNLITSYEDVTVQMLIDGGYVSFANGELQIDLDGGADSLETWFTVYVDSTDGIDPASQTNTTGIAPTAPAWELSDSVTIDIAGQFFTFGVV